jgi:uncharacterized membrane protein YjdF
MRFAERFSLPEGKKRLLTRCLQLVLASIMIAGLATFRLGMAANGAFGLGLTLLPALLRREYDYTMDPGLTLWITVAIFLHSVGSLGPYGWFSWYDSVTHTISATVIAGVGYAGFRAFERHSDSLDVGPNFRAVFIVVFVLAASVVWELLEFASGGIASMLNADAPLTVYGIDDIVSDMISNTLGAFVVAIWGSSYFGGLADFLRHRLGTREDN